MNSLLPLHSCAFAQVYLKLSSDKYGESLMKSLFLLQILNGGYEDSPPLGQGKFCGSSSTLLDLPVTTSPQAFIVYHRRGRHKEVRYSLTWIILNRKWKLSFWTPQWSDTRINDDANSVKNVNVNIPSGKRNIAHQRFRPFVDMRILTRWWWMCWYNDARVMRELWWFYLTTDFQAVAT